MTDTTNTTTTSSDSSVSLVSPIQPLLWFIIITTVYAFIIYNARKTPGSENSGGLMYFCIYILLVIIGEFFFNVNITTNVCGSSQWSTALTVTLIPWIFIFGLLVALLTIFPSWLKPFSNTFGYAVVLMMGLSKVFKQILPDSADRVNPPDAGVSKSLEYIYSDTGLLINMITPANFTNFYERMQKDRLIVNDSTDLRDKMYHLVVLKEIVSIYMWYLLAGILITSVSYNSIINSSCTVNAAEMQQRHSDYEKEMQKASETAQAAQDKRVYTSNE